VKLEFGCRHNEPDGNRVHEEDAGRLSLTTGLIVVGSWIVLMMVYYRFHRDPKGTRLIRSTRDTPPVQDVVSFYGGLGWRRWRVGAWDVRAPFARLDIGTDGLAISPTFAWVPWYIPVWRFRPADVHVEDGGWAARLIVSEAHEIIFQPVLATTAAVIREMEAHGFQVSRDARPARYVRR
jgi:hypothetical protein